MDFNALTPVVAEFPTRTRNRGTAGPNPFITNGWLKGSYDRNEAQSVTVPGAYEEYVSKKGASAGETRQRLTGDAAQIVSLLRAAADELNIGVSIDVAQAMNGKREVKGQMTITYLGHKRKAPRKSGEATASE